MKIKALSPKEKFQRVKELKEKGKSRDEIAEALKINKKTLNGIIAAINKGFNSINEHKGYLARQKINPETGIRFVSKKQYEDYHLRQKGFSSPHEYKEHLASERGFNSLNEYNKYLARKKGYRSIQRARMALYKLKRPIELLNKNARQSGYKDFYSYKSIRKILRRTAPIGTTSKQQELEDSIILLPPKNLEQTLVTPIENKNNQDEGELIKILIQKLPERERKIIEKRYFQGKTLKEIGKEYAITKEGIRIIQYRTLNILREIYEIIFIRKPSSHKQTPPFWERNHIQRRKCKNPELYTLI